MNAGKGKRRVCEVDSEGGKGRKRSVEGFWMKECVEWKVEGG